MSQARGPWYSPLLALGLLLGCGGSGQHGTAGSGGAGAKYAGFSGFGYVSTFMAKPQSVSFDVEARAGTYQVDFRYSAMTGAATRSVPVDGKLVTPTQSFPATASWDQWAVSSTIVALNGGKATIQHLYDNSSSGGLNLDRIDLIAQ